MKNVIENLAMAIAVAILLILGGLISLILWTKSLIGFKNQIKELNLKDENTLNRGWAYQPNMFDIETTHSKKAKEKLQKLETKN